MNLCRGVFRTVIGFGTKDFIPHTTWSLLTKLMFKHSVNRRSIKDSMRILLTEESNLGTHTDIFVYYAPTERHNSWTLLRYTWASTSTRPFTVNKPMQCPKCCRMPDTVLHTASASKTPDGDAVLVHFRCKVASCTWEKEETASAKIIDLKDAYSILTRINKHWSEGNGQWCSENMDLTV
jgi:hypothetical protein